MEIALIYFTGTFNNLYITTRIKNKLLAQGHKVDTYVFNDGLKMNINKYDMIGIGSKITYRNLPLVVIRKIKDLNIKNKKIFIYTCGGYNSKYNLGAIKPLYSILKNHNQIVNYKHMTMISNFKIKTNPDIIEEIIAKANDDIDNLINNLDGTYQYKVSLFISFICSLYRIKLRYMTNINSTRFKYDKDKCIKCRRCQDNCPNKNIKYDYITKRVVFLENCLMCGRCFASCPVDAISIGIQSKHKINPGLSPFSIKSE